MAFDLMEQSIFLLTLIHEIRFVTHEGPNEYEILTTKTMTKKANELGNEWALRHNGTRSRVDELLILIVVPIWSLGGKLKTRHSELLRSVSGVMVSMVAFQAADPGSIPG